MPWQPLIASAEVADGEMRQIEFASQQLLLCRSGEQLFALANECPHAGGPLAMGNFSPPYIACPWHAWEFDCRTGECVSLPAARVTRYPVEIRAGHVWVDLPEHP